MTNLSEIFSFTPPPPAGLGKRFRFYSERYGALHAFARFAATRFPPLWRMVGPAVSGGYRRDWVSKTGHPRLLNLGGGSNTIEGGLTVDLDPRADSYVNVTERLPFADAYFDFILLEEVIEHVDKETGLALLRECHRVLAPGGVIRLTTPDLDWLSAGTLDGSVDNDLVNHLFYEHGHRYIYSRKEMLAALARAGFTTSRHSTYREPGSSLGFLDTHAERFDHPPEMSQYVEATA